MYISYPNEWMNMMVSYPFPRVAITKPRAFLQSSFPTPQNQQHTITLHYLFQNLRNFLSNGGFDCIIIRLYHPFSGD